MSQLSPVSARGSGERDVGPVGRVVDWVVDHPWSVSGVFAGLTGVHGLLTWPFAWLSPYKAAQFPLDSNAISIAVTTALGVTSAAAILAGLAGVIIVFTIGSASSRLREFRSKAGGPLQRTWLAVVAEPLVAAGLGILSAITEVTSGRVVAPFLTQLGALLLAHTGFRLVWLLRELIRIVAADDTDAQENARTRSVSELLGNS